MKLVSVYSARDGMQARFLAGVLENAGIDAVVSGENLKNSIGASPILGAAPQVHVRAEDVDRARQIIERFDRSASASHRLGERWTCPDCGESLEPQFTDCWNCGTARPVAHDEPTTGNSAVRAPADPHIPLDLPCTQCGYNLRSLAIDRNCPECGHPSFTSLFRLLQSPLSDEADEARFADLIQPCLDAAESAFAFPIDAIAFFTNTWPRTGDPITSDDDLFVRMRDLATGFIGDPLSAGKTIDRWGIATPSDARRLFDKLVLLRLIHIARQ